jgi:protein-disulfide isomerase
MRNIWKNLAGAAALCAVFLGAPAQANDAEPPKPDGQVADLKLSDKDYSIGPKDAKVVIVEYASLTCPHCANFHTKEMPPIKKEFVETGKVRFVYRDFPLDRTALLAAMIARCAGRDRYFAFLDTFYATQSQWAGASNPQTALMSLARLGGMAQKDFEACTRNEEVQNAILAQRLEGSNEFKIRSTPTVFVNGASYSGGMTAEQLRTLLNRLLGKQ